MRAFIAIELPREIKDSLVQLQDKLKSSSADVKWVEPNNIHLTLKFLGEIEDERLGRINSILENIAENKIPFHASISSIGAFPRISSPRVIWAGIDEGDKETKEIVKILEERIEKLGIPKEDRAFSSHITIGRRRSGLNIDKLSQSLKTLENDFAKRNLGFNVTKITLFNSTLTPKGPIYEVLKEANLKAI
jgi:2'-5' RNA ligase